MLEDLENAKCIANMFFCGENVFEFPIFLTFSKGMMCCELQKILAR